MTNRNVMNLAAAGLAVVGSVITTTVLTATIVANVKNKQAIEKSEKELRAKHDRFREIEQFKKAEIEELKKQKDSLEAQINELEELAKRRDAELKSVKEGLAESDGEKIIFTIVSGLQDSLLDMAAATRQMNKDIEEIRQKVN